MAFSAERLKNKESDDVEATLFPNFFFFLTLPAFYMTHFQKTESDPNNWGQMYGVPSTVKESVPFLCAVLGGVEATLWRTC